MLLLAGCASGSPLAPGGSLADLARFTVDDLTAALADAQAHGDQAGVNCWATLLGVVQSGVVVRPPTVKGIASAIQVKRDLMGASGGGGASVLAKQINVGCAALFVDENYTLLKLGGGAFGMPTGLLP